MRFTERSQTDAYLAPIAPPQRRKPQRLFKSVGALHEAFSGPKVAPAFTDYGAPLHRPTLRNHGSGQLAVFGTFIPFKAAQFARLSSIRG